MRAAGIAGKDVVRRSLAGKAMMISLDARSKHDLGPLRCGKRVGAAAGSWLTTGNGIAA
jgi:hypothetical protein